MLPSRNSFYSIAMSLLWSLWMISTALAVPFPVNTIQTGMVTDGNNDHLDAYAVRSDSYALVARGEGNSKVAGSSTSGSTSSKKAVFYYFDCESDEFLGESNQKLSYLHKGKSSLEGHTIIELILTMASCAAAWYLESDPGQPSTVRPRCSGKYRLTKFELSYGGLKVLDLTTQASGRTSKVLSESHDILKTSSVSHSPVSKNLAESKKRLDEYDVIIFTPPSSQTYAALMNSKATKSADLKYVLQVTAEYEVGAWEAMQRAEGQGMEEVQETGDWTDDSA
ncbi:hypothetical protein DFJ43DRAFT_687790 [Lentinula guzmanii]|uniref:Uncharacterized protein n=1 Tax=Lentinula guzmanii TaxID=2804957 RepID=A0AA38J5R8_9AGAR|nr:hypothetical protein DFJ43DRAFT_687790 [Lentinula guzmanii]